MSIELNILLGQKNKYLGSVATRTLIPTTCTTSNKQQMSRCAHIARDHIVGIKLVYPNFYVDASGVEQGTGNTATFAASIEYPNNNFTRVTFGNANSVIANSKTLVTSDLIPINIPKGQKFWDKCHRADGSGIIYNSPGVNFKSNTLHGDAFNFSTTTVPDTTMTNTATNLDITNHYQPIAVLGYTKYGSVIYYGDSIGFGQGDTVDAAGDTGVFRYVGSSKGYINACRPSDRATWFANTSNSAIRRSLAQYASDIIVQHTINDLGSGSRSVAEVQGDLANIATDLKTSYPTKRVWVATTIPQTTSNSNVTPSTTNSNRITLNNWKRLVPSPFDGCIELADAVEASRDAGTFANATYTTDGTHMSNVGYSNVASSGFVDATSFDF